ncbi:MAG: acyl-ACP--UDP-N-acetylglucosamine O-acyltransferase [Elusimicrobiota bacterium]
MKDNKIHPTAIIEEGARIDSTVEIGPYAVIKSGVEIGAGTTVDAHAVIEGNTIIGKNNTIGIGVVIGNRPQDLKYKDEETHVTIGDGNIIREYVTINRGTIERGVTSLGNNIMLMSYVHIAHDCIVGDEVILANCVTLAGHVTIEDQAVIGGLTPIHQFTRIGKLSIIGGSSRVPKDILPYCMAAGNRLKITGLNTIGLKRRNFSAEDRSQLKKAYRIIFRSGLNTAQAVEKMKSMQELTSPHVTRMIQFIETSERGIYKS